MADRQNRYFLVTMFLFVFVAACVSSYTPESRLVEVNDQRLNIRCSGEGTPATILVSGLATDNHDWVNVEKQLSERFQVCSYDRAGLGMTNPLNDMPTAQTASDNLRALISVSGISGPVILVGHSYGGLIAQLYAAQHPADTFGVVLVDSLHHENLERARLILGEQSMSFFLEALNANPENVDIPASLEQVRDINLGDTPLTVLTAGEAEVPPIIDPEVGRRLVSAWLYSQIELAGLSTTGVQFVAEGSRHCIQCDRPDVVVDAIKEMADEVRFQ